VQSSGALEGTGQISLSGAGTALDIAGAATIGDAGSAALTILNGATLNAASLTIGAQGTGSGEAFVSDTGSLLDLTGTLYVGTALGVGELTIGPNATVIAHRVIQQGEVVDEGGTLDPPGGGEIDITPGNPFVGFGTLGGVGDLIVNTGSIEAKAGSKASQTTLTVIGTLVGSSNGLAAPGTGAVVIDAGTTLVMNGPVDASQAVDFATGTGVLELDEINGFQGTIASFAQGDEIFVNGASVATDSFVNNVLTLYAAGGGTIGTLDFASGLFPPLPSLPIALDPNAQGGVGGAAPCFAAGTRIATERGEVAVEDLRVGERVQTVLGGGLAEVIWVGRRAVDCARHAQPKKVWPVRVAAGAFGPGQPHTDLLLSPDHAVYVEQVLIPVKYLINASTIVQVPVERVTYHHIELAEHDVLLAEGLPAESFLDMRDGSNYANRPGPVRLYPDYAARMWEAFGCARLVVTGAELEAARALVARFAAAREAA